MRVILLQDVPKVGRKYDTKDVPDGYGTNFLIARKLAVIASPAKVAEIEKLKRELGAQREAGEAELMAGMQKINGVELVIKGKASDKGHLFSAVHKKDIKEKLATDFGILLNEDNLNIKDGLKEVGQYDIEVKVGDKKAKFKLLIEAIK